MSEISAESLDIRQDTSEGKFYFHMVGQAEAYLRYTLHTDNDPNIMEFTEIHVPEVLEGIGVEDEMTRQAIRFADRVNYKVKPTCAYVSGWMGNHPQFDYLRAR